MIRQVPDQRNDFRNDFRNGFCNQFRAPPSNVEQLLREGPRTPNDVIVFDLDDTLFHSIHQQPREDIYRLYFDLVRKGFNIAIITARLQTPSIIELTRRQLARYGISYMWLYLRPEQIMDFRYYKTQARYDIRRQGGNIIASIGDQPSDHGPDVPLNVLV
jgi:hypothetical protein